MKNKNKCKTPDLETSGHKTSGHKTSGHKTSVLPQDTSLAVRKLIEIVDGLSVVLDEETKALKGSNNDVVTALQDKKLDAARAYQAGIGEAMMRQDEIRAADAALKKELEATRNSFSAVAKANLEALDRMNKSVQRLGERVMRIARETAVKEQQLSYGAHGGFSKGEKATMGINESA